MAGWPCGEGTHHASNNCEVVSTADCLPSTMFCAVQYSDHTPRLRDSYEVLVLCGLSSPRNKVRRAVLAADLQPSLGLAHLYPTPHPSPLRVSAIIHAAYPQPARVTPSGTRQSPFKFSTLLGLFFLLRARVTESQSSCTAPSQGPRVLPVRTARRRLRSSLWLARYPSASLPGKCAPGNPDPRRPRRARATVQVLYLSLYVYSTSTLAAFFTGATIPNKASPLHYSASSCLSLSLASSRRRPSGRPGGGQPLTSLRSPQSTPALPCPEGLATRNGVNFHASRAGEALLPVSRVPQPRPCICTVLCRTFPPPCRPTRPVSPSRRLPRNPFMPFAHHHPGWAYSIFPPSNIRGAVQYLTSFLSPTYSILETLISHLSSPSSPSP